MTFCYINMSVHFGHWFKINQLQTTEACFCLIATNVTIIWNHSQRWRSSSFSLYIYSYTTNQGMQFPSRTLICCIKIHSQWGLFAGKPTVLVLSTSGKSIFRFVKELSAFWRGVNRWRGQFLFFFMCVMKQWCH